MPTDQSSHGIVNGHWEPTPPQLPKVITVVRASVGKLLGRLHHHSPKANEPANSQAEQHEPVAAE